MSLTQFEDDVNEYNTKCTKLFKNKTTKFKLDQIKLRPNSPSNKATLHDIEIHINNLTACITDIESLINTQMVNINQLIIDGINEFKLNLIME